MKRFKWYWGLILVALVTLLAANAGCVTVVMPDQAAQPSGFLTYTDTANGFSFSYPQGWEQQTQGLEPGVLIIFGATQPEAGFVTNMNVVKGTLDPNQSLDAYFEFNKSVFQSLSGCTYTFLSKEAITVNGVPAIKHTFTLTCGELSSKAVQLYISQGTVVYVVSCGCAPTVFNSYESTFNTIINSFRFLQTASTVPSTSTPAPTPSTGLLTYTDNANGFSIAYPQDWQKMPQYLLTEDALVGFFRGTGQADTSSYNVMMGEWPSGMTVEDLYAGVKSDIEATTEGYSFIAKDNLTINGIPAIKHTCTFRAGGQTLKAIQVLLVKDNKAWFLTLASPPEYFAQNEPTFNAIINSFQVSDTIKYKQ